ncbi:hypothetical protein [Azospirillum thermophilum]|uniref:Uncharacterized protein n=1 Tax=Azospirillum thermophilum TaxID=2202148 RepID=A0A2S2CRE8_9PROT|nr:hypothetical protein [Azospirillum thermophilum]AWK87058.1 hypothetical protein DEW08_13210 [Azospirillum thermophilum]
MRSKFLLAALPALLLGLAACDDQSTPNSGSSNTNEPAATGTSPSGAPVTGGTSGSSMNNAPAPTTTAPGGSTAGGAAGGGGNTSGGAPTAGGGGQ